MNIKKDTEFIDQANYDLMLVSSCSFDEPNFGSLIDELQLLELQQLQSVLRKFVPQRRLAIQFSQLVGTQGIISSNRKLLAAAMRWIEGTGYSGAQALYKPSSFQLVLQLLSYSCNAVGKLQVLSSFCNHKLGRRVKE